MKTAVYFRETKQGVSG